MIFCCPQKDLRVTRYIIFFSFSSYKNFSFSITSAWIDSVINTCLKHIFVDFSISNSIEFIINERSFICWGSMANYFVKFRPRHASNSNSLCYSLFNSKFEFRTVSNILQLFRETNNVIEREGRGRGSLNNRKRIQDYIKIHRMIENFTRYGMV